MTKEQAVKLAHEAHRNQWRRSKPASKEEIEEFEKVLESLFITSEGNLFSYYAPTGSQEESYFVKEPYITHPLEVMNMVDTDEEKVIAVLHDVVEDCEGYELEQKGSRYFIKAPSDSIFISSNIYYALQCLTKRKHEKYEDYIKFISENKLATKIKIADITCNLLDNPSDRQKEKYKKAMKQLLQSI